MTKYVMHIENDHSFKGIVGISLLEKEDELIAKMKKEEAEDDVCWNTPLKRLEFEINEEGYAIVDEKNMTFPNEPCPDGRGHGKSFM